MTLRDALREALGIEPRVPEPAASPEPARPPRVGLALGGGGVRGAAHLGVLSVLEGAGVPIDVVAGTSVGAIVGAGVAARVGSAAMLERFRTARWIDLARPSWHSRISMFDANPMIDILIATVHAETFEELALPFAAVASDMLSGRPVVFRSGPLRPAVLASAAVPGLFEPVRRDGQLLADGGVTVNLPVAQARDLGADVVIAVDIMPQPDASYEPKDIGEMVMLSLSIMEWEREAACDRADVCITPDVARFNLMDLSQVQHVYDAGVEAGTAALPSVLAAVGAAMPEAAGARA